ncbi:MAG: BREX system serine/threonine kinase PglW [Thiocapsa sp.]|uniref:BREX system serine/threonine kinase PglW n=1 Tax=Thiocapsa sp. TaxID=2024551 RepID=UPI001BCAAFCF|nr:BREX system serine/threonine kinase PglW [Thiocapsa sp.]QVL47095.1 MAG: BREX system serine/threonine kinase PglW [Thiocapsa sp.]
MPMTSRWTAIAQSQFPWEREALDWLREQLPDLEPWHAWSNFEFIDDDGRVNEVDTLVLAPAGLFLIEIKSRPGLLTGDAHTWTWSGEGRRFTDDNPLVLTNRKAKRLVALLRRQPALAKARLRVPWVQPLVFLSSTRTDCRLDLAGRAHVHGRGTPGRADDPGILAALTVPVGGAMGAVRTPRVDRTAARAIVKAIAESGIRPSNRSRRVGDYQLNGLLAEGDGWQDFEGVHVSAGVHRRIRVYPFAGGAGEPLRADRKRSALREFQILEGMTHPGIVKLYDFKESELGPALVFELDPQAQRLDFWLRERAETLNLDLRLQVLRQLADVLRYAHGRRLYHRALAPQNVLVKSPDSAAPVLQVLNWQAAVREATAGATHLRTQGTAHIEAHLEAPSQVYLAPEALRPDIAAGPHMDVFSLGAIAYLLFTGKPPASSILELAERLRTGHGLRISDTLDGSVQALQDLVQSSTQPEVSSRIATVDEFLDYLELVEDELTTPAPEATVDPTVARKNDRLDGGFTVLAHLGKGSSAVALKVRPDGSDEDLVLKVALDQTQDERVRAEGEVLAQLGHPNIVKYRGTRSVAGRTAVLMTQAGEQTLRKRIYEPEPLSLDLVARFGEELLSVVNYLEAEGVTHRDIKPDNIGIATAKDKRLALVLYDFSLARTAPENLNAGTRPYLDPFLSLRKPPRWDLYAERFAVAMTLYELLGRALPTWGDGASEAATLDCEATIESERFDPALREGLTAFFAKALRREARERYDNAEEMLRAWRRVFDEARRPTSDADDLDAIARRATPTTTIAELGYGLEAQNVLDQMHIHSVRELLAVDRVRFRYLKGVGDKVRKEIRLRAKRLAQLRPDLVPGGLTLLDSEAVGGPGAADSSIDDLAARLLPRRPLGDDRPEERALGIWLGLEPVPESGAAPAALWPALGAAARACDLARGRVTDALVQARERWLKAPAITAVREQIMALLEAHGGAMTNEETARALLAARGSVERVDQERLSLAGAVARAAVEAEAGLAAPRFLVFDGPRQPLVARDQESADWVLALGREADRLAVVEPILSPQRIRDALQAVPAPDGLVIPAPSRLVKLAADASVRAALSSRGELYPRGMAPAQAIALAFGALAGQPKLTVEQIRERVLGRYPEAAPLPAPPALDGLLTEAGLDLVWRPNHLDGPAYERSAGQFDPTAGSSTTYQRLATIAAGLPVTPEIAAARQLEQKLDSALRGGGFLALSCGVRLARHVEDELLRRFDLARLSLDALLLKAMRDQAEALQVSWPLVSRADGGGPRGGDWGRLQQLVSRAVPTVRERILSETRAVLLTQPGLMGRYRLQGLLTDLQDAVSRPGGLPGLWMLVPMIIPGPPAVDGFAIPTISAAQWAVVPEAWTKNLHRTGTGEQQKDRRLQSAREANSSRPSRAD